MWFSATFHRYVEFFRDNHFAFFLQSTGYEAIKWRILRWRLRLSPTWLMKKDCLLNILNNRSALAFHGDHESNNFRLRRLLNIHPSMCSHYVLLNFVWLRLSTSQKIRKQIAVWKDDKENIYSSFWHSTENNKVERSGKEKIVLNFLDSSWIQNGAKLKPIRNPK